MPIPSDVVDQPVPNHMLSCILILATLYRDLDPPDSLVQSSMVQPSIEEAFDHAVLALAYLIHPAITAAREPVKPDGSPAVVNDVS